MTPIILLLVQCLTIQVLPSHVKRVIDGDTFILYSVGVPNEERVRILGVDTPELGMPGADSARAYTIRWLTAGSFVMKACKRDSFGRYLAVITRYSDTLSVDLIRDGHGIYR